jgi:sulfur dioxygenase
MIMKQFNFDGCLSYVIASSDGRIGAIIDPSHDVAPYLAFAKEENLKILYCIDTHTHVDHVSLAMELADALKARTVMSRNAPLQREIGAGADNLPGIGEIMEANARKRIDILMEEGERLRLGNIYLEAVFTPGHTKDSMCLISHGRIFAGDTLLIGQCGRTDLPGGDPGEMRESLFGKLASLSNDIIVYPAHDYRGNINSSMGYERINNVCLNQKRTPQEFASFLKGLFPPLSMDGGKLQCGLTMEKGADREKEDALNPLMKGFCISMEHYLESPHEETLVRAGELSAGLSGEDKPFILDVREPSELAQNGFIEGAVNIPVGQVALRVADLPADLGAPVVVVCESGIRSAYAGIYLRAYGYGNVTNLEFGMREWREKGYPVVFPEKGN